MAEVAARAEAAARSEPAAAKLSVAALGPTVPMARLWVFPAVMTEESHAADPKAAVRVAMAAAASTQRPAAAGARHATASAMSAAIPATARAGISHR